MGYYEFTVTAPDESKDALLNKMSEMGCLGVSEIGKRLIAYFKDTHDIIQLRDGLESFKSVLKQAGLDPGFSFDYLYLSERDWNEPWKKRFIPMDVGEQLSILPPWETSDKSRIPLIIDPGMAFGTGHHETTKACLQLIEKFSKTSPKDRFLDVGTGTGILAIAASRLGFKAVVGVDIDPLAIDAAKRNAELNSLQNVEIQEGTITEVRGSFDMIAANLMSEVLISIAPEIAGRLNYTGIAVLSGMLKGQEDDVQNAMKRSGISARETLVDGRWVSLVLALR
jgi:ribosomal protein L11 methyltransferase